MLVTGDVDVDDAARVYVGWEENGGELDLQEGHGQRLLLCRGDSCGSSFDHILRDTLRVIVIEGGLGEVLSTHQTLVLGEEHGDSSVDLADSQGYQHGEVCCFVSEEVMRDVFTADRNALPTSKGPARPPGAVACWPVIALRTAPTLAACQFRSTPTPKHRSLSSRLPSLIYELTTSKPQQENHSLQQNR